MSQTNQNEDNFKSVTMSFSKFFETFTEPLQTDQLTHCFVMFSMFSQSVDFWGMSFSSYAQKNIISTGRKDFL